MASNQSKSKAQRLIVASITDLAGIVKRRREELGWSIVQASEEAGTSRFFVADLEKGKPTCQFDKIMAVLGALQLKVELRAGAPKFTAPRKIHEVADERRSIRLGPAIALDRAHDVPSSIGCFECGQRVRNLQRHLSSAHSMRTTDYRRRWSLPEDFDLRPVEVAQAADTRKQVKGALTRRNGA